MVLQIRVLGRPRIAVDGTPRTLAGAKPWALLTYLLLEGRPPSRRELAERLWPDAADPFAALRWTLLQVRRAIGPEAGIADADGSLVLHAPGADIDVVGLLDGRLAESADRWQGTDVDVGGELLAGMAFDDAPDFELWLSLQRTRVRSAATATLRWAGTVWARRDPTSALRLLERALQLDPFDDVAHEVIVGIHVDRGDLAEARAHIARAGTRYRDELGEPLPEAVSRPLERRTHDRDRRADGAPGARARAQLDAAAARLDAGEYEAAIGSARRAVAAAAEADDAALEARALLSLAGALIHSVRGRDREATGLLARATTLAEAAGDERLLAEIDQEIGWVAFLDAEYGAAEAALSRSVARSRRVGDEVAAARALVVLGASRSDRGEHDEAERCLVEAVATLDAAGDRWRAFGRSFISRIALFRGDAAAALDLADLAVEQARAGRWLALVPWPLALAGWAAAASGDRAGATERLDEAHALAREIADPCWEAFSLRGLALVERQDARPERARELLRGALACTRRFADIYTWAEALVLTDLATLDDRFDPVDVERARALARRGPMPDLLARLPAPAPGPAR